MPKMMINEIKTRSPHLRKDETYEDLISSMEEVGLIHPVVVNVDGELLAGMRRLNAAKKLGWHSIDVHRVDVTHLDAELISIDENLIRIDLTDMKSAKALKRRKEIYEIKYPETKKHVRGAMVRHAKDDSSVAKGFVEDTAKKTGLNARVIRRAIHRVENASPAIVKAIEANRLSNAQADSLLSLSHKDQEKLLPVVEDLSCKQVREVVTRAKEEGVKHVVDSLKRSREAFELFSKSWDLTKRLHPILKRISESDMRVEGFDGAKWRLDLGQVLKWGEKIMNAKKGGNHGTKNQIIDITSKAR